MVQRFLEYSLRYQRPIKVIFLEDDQIVSRNLTVTALRDESIDYLSSKNRRLARTLAFDKILSCSYSRGDDGDPLKNEERLKKPPTPV